MTPLPAVVTNPAIYNVSIAAANTEYSQALPANCRYFYIWSENNTDLYIAFVTGKVATPTRPYIKAKEYESPATKLASQTIYVAGSAGDYAIIEAWS